MLSSNEDRSLSGDSIESTISKVRALCIARLDYNESLIEFFSNSPATEVKTYVVEALAPWDATVDPELVKVEWIRKTNDDANLYREQILKIDQSKKDQALIDELYFKFSSFFEEEKIALNETHAEILKMPNSKERKAYEKTIRARTAQMLEYRFIKEVVELCSEEASEAQKAFLDSGKFLVSQGTTQFELDLKIVERKMKKIGDYCSQLIGIFKEFEQLQPSFQKAYQLREKKGLALWPHQFESSRSLYNQCLLACNHKRSEEYPGHNKAHEGLEFHRQDLHKLFVSIPGLKEMQENFHRFHDFFCFSQVEFNRMKTLISAMKVYCEILELDKPMVHQEKGKRNDIVKAEKRKEPVPEITVESRPESQRPQKVGEKGDSQTQLDGEFEDQRRKEQTAQYRAEVEARRTEKRKEKSLKPSPLELSSAQPSGHEKGLVLLQRLNSRNLNLLQALFARPVLLNIRFDDIRNLVGSESGKLPGRIQQSSGSHRKLEIADTFGFFDEVNVSLVEGEATKAVGPLFEAHGRAHSGKLPAVAVRMVCKTLERVGISREVLDAFLSKSQQCLESKSKEDSISCTM